MAIAGAAHCINLTIDIFVPDFTVQLTFEVVIYGNESAYGWQGGHGAILMASMAQV
jgi:hypothetical protein